MNAPKAAQTGLHFALGNTYRGLVIGWAGSVCLALASALTNNLDWKQTLAGILLITGPLLGASADQGSKPAKEDMPK